MFLAVHLFTRTRQNIPALVLLFTSLTPPVFPGEAQSEALLLPALGAYRTRLPPMCTFSFFSFVTTVRFRPCNHTLCRLKTKAMGMGSGEDGNFENLDFLFFSSAFSLWPLFHFQLARRRRCAYGLTEGIIDSVIAPESLQPPLSATRLQFRSPDSSSAAEPTKPRSESGK